jgi:hypothetical protein
MSGEALAEIASSSTTCFYRLLSAPLLDARMAMMEINFTVVVFRLSRVPGVYMCTKPRSSPDRDLAADPIPLSKSRCTTLSRT